MSDRQRPATSCSFCIHRKEVIEFAVVFPPSSAPAAYCSWLRYPQLLT